MVAVLNGKNETKANAQSNPNHPSNLDPIANIYIIWSEWRHRKWEHSTDARHSYRIVTHENVNSGFHWLWPTSPSFFSTSSPNQNAMGKKRSKTSKQKQARASKTFGGVSIKKGGTQKQSPLVLEASKSRIAKSHGKKSIKFSYIKAPLPIQKKNEEQADFDRQLESMEERQWCKNRKIQKKKNKSILTLTPATLLVSNAEKSTMQLIEEATTGVQALQDIGKEQTPQTTSNRLQVLAAQQRAAWTREAALEEEKSQNAFAVLQQHDSDDDHGWGDDHDTNTRQKAPPLFQLAPPSFGVPVVQDDDDDVDPDLWDTLVRWVSWKCNHKTPNRNRIYPVFDSLT